MLIWTNFQSVAFHERVECSPVGFCASAEGRLHSTFGVNTRRSELLPGVNFGEQVSRYSEGTAKQRPEIFGRPCRIPAQLFDDIVKAGHRPTRRPVQETL